MAMLVITRGYLFWRLSSEPCQWSRTRWRWFLRLQRSHFSWGHDCPPMEIEDQGVVSTTLCKYIVTIFFLDLRDYIRLRIMYQYVILYCLIIYDIDVSDMPTKNMCEQAVKRSHERLRCKRIPARRAQLVMPWQQPLQLLSEEHMILWECFQKERTKEPLWQPIIRWYVYRSQSWVVYGIVFPTLYIYILFQLYDHIWSILSIYHWSPPSAPGPGTVANAPAKNVCTPEIAQKQWNIMGKP